MRITKTDFKLRFTNNEYLKCHSPECKKKLYGSKGYLSLCIGGTIHGFSGEWIDVKICRDCFERMIKEYEKEKKGIGRRYKKHQRKRLIQKLKK